MSIETVSGTHIRISAAKPATFDAAGYAALTFTKIGEITDGGTHGRTYSPVLHKPIDNRGTQKRKGGYDDGDKTLQLAIDDDDAGQILCKTALNSDADYSFEVEYQGGSIDYFQAQVMSFLKATGSGDTIRSATLQIAITTTKSGIGIVEVEAP